MKETQFTSAIISITKKLVNGQFNITEPEKNTLISLLLPPCVTVENLKKLEQLGKTLKAEFVKNPCYNSGRLTTMALPLIVTGGVYALEKIPALLVSVTSKGIKVTKKIQALLKSSFKLKPKTNGSGYVLNDGDVVLANYDDLGGFVDDADNLPVQGAGNWVTTFPKLASKTSVWSHLELVFEGVDDYVRILSKNGDEVGKVIKNGTDEIFEISDDFFRATPSNPATPITGMTVKANTGESIIGGGFFKNADGSIGFVEDVSSYGSTIVQNTIKNRGGLRGTINGITATQDAHHIIPVQLLKENDVVKKAVEGGFSFNTSANGLGIEKYVKATGAGRHGPHPSYTNQIRNYLTKWANDNPGFTPQMARDELADVVNAVKNKINTTSGKINEINLGL